MSPLKVVTIVGTRPELIRLSELIKLMDTHTDHYLVHTGQNDDPNLYDIFLRDLELRKPDKYLAVNTSTPGTVIGDTISKVETVLSAVKPQAVLILGDTNSALAAIISERMGIPVYHMEAGNRSFDLNVPEELNRRLVDHVASFNLPYNGHSMRNLLSEGVHPRQICVTGSPLREILEKHQPKIFASNVMKRLGLEKNGFILASIHRQENVDDWPRLDSLLRYLSSLNNHFQCPVIVSTHPRTRNKLEAAGRFEAQGVQFLEPFGFFDYCNLQMNARIVISDSGTVAEESAILGFPAATLRESMERPEALHSGSIRIVNPGHDLSELEQFIDEVADSSMTPEGYDVANFSWRVLNFVLSTAPLHRTWLNLKAR